MSELTGPIIAGNWKMHLGPAETAAFFEDFVERLPGPIAGTIVFFPPAISFGAARAALTGRDDILLGVQNVHWEAKGAFTGEISAQMAASAGARLVLVGHSERRHVFGETGEETRRKTEAALSAGLIPVLCVGETIEEREAGRAADVVEAQLSDALASLDVGTARNLLIAYEPVWAIGTGRTATPADAEEMHGTIRTWLAGRVGGRTAADVPILYGGSVKPENAGELLRASDVGGVLVGGASLEPAGFARICTALA
jgi:triosephosphate isomerase (TIM)